MLQFATAESTRQREGESDIAHCNRTFRPSSPGVHICGADHEDNRFFTILDWPTRTEGEARDLFEAVKAECAVEGDDFDFVVDLNTDAGHVDDFYSVRQLLPRIYEILQAKARGETPSTLNLKGERG